MPKKNKTPIRTIYTDHLYDKEDLRSFMLPLYISRIDIVENIDTGETFKFTLTCKMVYGYLTGLGYNYGYNSVYPNIKDIADCIAVNEKTVRLSIKTLESIGLIKIVKGKDKQGRFDSNHYWVYRPNIIPRRRWLDIDGNIMIGKHYKFDVKQFKLDDREIKADKLLRGLLELNKDLREELEHFQE